MTSPPQSKTPSTKKTLLYKTHQNPISKTPTTSPSVQETKPLQDLSPSTILDSPFDMMVLVPMGVLVSEEMEAVIIVDVLRRAGG
ncbi:hypothetical protein NC653_024067 [Populus alba x Populus x berolinensis]|uniref:Uncharacterized protein n=1 Tax=Populus alba x Populus x berolinensis TaxID=444605 RepID=A0AAD6MIT5_9ROSI|nr:hypothetical protein NC653_024067 [Populus alba x Populus x berolinensis]